MATSKSTANKIEKRISAIPNKTFGILNFDFDNKYPQRVIDIVNNSGTAKTCLRIFAKFVMGGGAVDKDFFKSRVNNKGLTVDKLIRNFAEAKPYEAVVLHLNFNALGEVVEVTPIPWEHARLVTTTSDEYGKIAIHEDWGLTKGVKKSIKKEDIDYIHLFNPNSVLAEIDEAGGIENYKGQIYYWSKSGVDEYSLTLFDAVLEDMQTEGQTKKFKNTTASKNFLASHILVTGKTETDEQSAEFIENLQSFQGGENAGSIWWLERENNDEQIELKPIDIQDYDGLYEYTEKSAQESIRKQFLIPPILLDSVSTGFSQDELNNAKAYYSDVTSDDRLVIEEVLKDIFSIWHYKICPTGDYSIMPIPTNKPISVEYLSYYSKNEIRLKNGDLPDESKQGDTTLLAVTLGVSGTQALTAILSDPLLTPEQKKGSMKILFGLTEDQSNEMLGL